MSSHPEAAKRAPELVWSITSLARALVVAARNWSLYPPDHPAARASFERLSQAIRDATHDGELSIGVTPDSLFVDAVAVPASPQVTEAARLLHDRDLLRLTFSGDDVPPGAVATLLGIVALDRDALRARGGPEGIWREAGHPSIALEQIDYAYVLEDRDGGAERQQDDVWTRLVHSIAGGQTLLDALAQERLVAIAGDTGQIVDLALAVAAPKCTADGAPMIMTQAATVLAAFRQIVSIVSVKAADRADAVMRNLAEATARLDPNLVMAILQRRDEPDTVPVVAHIARAFDDAATAQLLATALSAEGQATRRLADVFDTIAPDAERKQRVLKMTRALLAETPFGQRRQFRSLWSSMEGLLLSYNEQPYVSTGYRAQLDSAGARADALAVRELPDEMPEWTASLGQGNVRTLSVSLIIDLLTLERDASRAAEVAADMAGLAEDLLMAGDYGDARRVTAALRASADDPDAPATAACQEALAQVAASAALYESVAMLADLDDNALALFTAICHLAGPATVDALGVTLRMQEDTPGRRRAADIIVGFGRAAVARLAPLVDDERPVVLCQAAALLGRIAAPDAVPLLQPLLRKEDPRVMRAAMSALANIKDPAAGRAIHTVLRSVAGERRRAVIAALVAERDPRVVPILLQILEESDPFGADHGIVLASLGALRLVHSEHAVRPIARMARRRRWYAPRKRRALARAALDALASIRTETSREALAKVAADGDRVLRRLARAKLAEAPQP